MIETSVLLNKTGRTTRAEKDNREKHKRQQDMDNSNMLGSHIEIISTLTTSN
jgi:hypothetical protein